MGADTLLKISQVARMTWSRPTIERKLKSGTFPKPDWIDPETGYRYWWESTITNTYKKAT